MLVWSVSVYLFIYLFIYVFIYCSIQVNEGNIDIKLVCQAQEAFCSGTGASVTPVTSVTYRGQKHTFNEGEVKKKKKRQTHTQNDRQTLMCVCVAQIGAVTREIYDTLLGIQLEKVPDTRGWLHDPWAQ